MSPGMEVKKKKLKRFVIHSLVIHRKKKKKRYVITLNQNLNKSSIILVISSVCIQALHFQIACYSACMRHI